MKVNCFFLLILLFSFTEQTTAEQDVCLTGCSLLRFGYCMTYNNTTGATEFGPCPYIGRYNTVCVDHDFYIQLASNVSLLNEFMCGPLNREGTLCGKCEDGYGIALYSYALECSKCWGHGYGWSCTISWNCSQ